MLSYFQARKQEIGEYLRVLFDEKADALSRVNPLGRDLCVRLFDFALRGKMIRGGLVSLGCSVAHGHACVAEQRPLTTGAGAAMELFQSGLLIHDDIMDRDATRRGLKSIFSQYAELAEAAGMADSYHLGESLGVCAGDVAYFLAFEVLGGLEVPLPICRDIVALAARELGYVGVAQMQDIYAGASGSPVLDEEVLRLYLYKTGRYTFSLPLMVGGVLAGGEPALLETLERLGETLGVVFQIKDDEIGLFGDAAETGKPVGSDIKEGKKTLYYGYLQRRAPMKDVERMAGIFGNPQIGEAEVEYVRELTEGLGIRSEIQERANQLAESGRALIEGLAPPRSEECEVLLALLDYSLSRTR
ncbi:MAG: polyprenyl synthetase family protein [Spirochaetales bacterium]|nr:polyprenyl synthetase family protein [Spirochaetales bacterium]